MPLEIIRNDITKMSVDAIVNAANTALKMGGGVCGAIFTAAGSAKLQEECDKIGLCQTGQAVITKGYNLPAKFIIHTVGPVWHGGNDNEAELLTACYHNSLLLAQKNKLSSIAFPLISSGIFGYPKDQALKISISAIGDYLLNHEDMMVYLVVYDTESFVLSEKLTSSIKKYIDDHYVESRPSRIRSNAMSHENYQSEYIPGFLPRREPCGESAAPQPVKGKRRLEDVLTHLDETFSQMLLRLIDQKGMSDVETYKKANIDRKLFSKIRSDKGYNPSKITALAFAIALELNLDETKDLLAKAGYTLSHSNKFDVIIEFFIEERNYNIFEINEALFAFDQSLLGS